MTSSRGQAWFFGIAALVFFTYLFGPLIVMSLTAFNSSEFPRVSPWECFSTEWFVKLAGDDKLMDGVRNSIVIGIGVVAMAVPIGLAGALMLTQVWRPARATYYTVVISPILVPGVVLGISTLIFWDRLGTMFGADYDSFFYDGMFLTIVGQSTFISAYCMLVFLARLQRFDPALEEAALDLGATNVQAFRKILLPFLKPAIGSAAVLAFLASFENYNTTVFTIISDSTLTTVLASKVRYGIDPSISALAVIIIGLTLAGAVIHEIRKRRETRVRRALGLEGGTAATRAGKAGAIANPGNIMVVLITVAGIATVWFASTYNTQECKLRVEQEKQRYLEKIERERQATQPAPAAPVAPTTQPQAPAPSGDKAYEGIFDPQNLKGQSGAEEAPAAPDKQYEGIFDPKNLKGQSGAGEAPAEPNKQYQGIFDPKNLKGQTGD